MIPNKDQMNKTAPLNTGGGLGFVDKAPAPRPAPRELISPVSNNSLVSGSNLGSTGMTNIPNSMPSMMRPPSPTQPMPLASTGKPKRNWPLILGFGGLVVGAGMIFKKQFGADEFELEGDDE